MSEAVPPRPTRSPAMRAFIGACIGAVLTLLIHPVSRPFLTTFFDLRSPQRYDACFQAAQPVVHRPRDLASAALWLQLGAERLAEGEKLSKSESSSLLSLSYAASKREPDNAFWFQFRAVLLSSLGATKDSKAAWLRASNCQNWNDYQSTHLIEARDCMGRMRSATQSWHSSVAYLQRSDAIGRLVAKCAELMLRGAPLDTSDGMELRYATARNGSLMRAGARSLRLGANGASMVELATYPAELSGVTSPKRIWIAQTQFTSRLRNAGKELKAQIAEEDFRSNDSWRILLQLKDPEFQTEEEISLSLVLALIPGAIAFTTLGGLLLWVCGSLVQRPLENLRFFTHPMVFGIATVCATLTFAISTSLLAAGAVFIIQLSLLAGPANPRLRRSERLGPLYSFIHFCLWLLLLPCAFFTMAGRTQPGLLLGGAAPTLQPYLENMHGFAAIGCLMLATLALWAPAWAMVRRFGTPDLLAVSMRRLGKTATLGGLLLIFIATPTCVYLDQLCARRLTQLVQNEPVHFLTQ